MGSKQSHFETPGDAVYLIGIEQNISIIYVHRSRWHRDEYSKTRDLKPRFCFIIFGAWADWTER